MNGKKIRLAVILIFLNASIIYAQEDTEIYAHEDIVAFVAEGNVHQITQNSSATLLAITLDDCVTVYDTATHSPQFVLYEDKAQKTAFYTENGNEYIAVMTASGSFRSRMLIHDENGWSCNFDEPAFTADCADSSHAASVSAVAFNRSSDYVAAAFNDGSIQIHFRLRFTKKLISRIMTDHKTAVYGLEFSPSGEYLASVALDGNAYIWNCYNNAKVTKLSGIYARAKVPVCFTEDSVYIISLDGKNSFRISDFSGNTLFSILTGRPITAIKPLKNPDLIAIRNDKNEVMIYSIASRRPVSVSTVTLDAESPAEFTSFEFDFAAELMYAGFSDGKVCVIEPQPYLEDSSMLVTDSSLIGNGEGGGGGASNPFTSLSFSAGANYMNAPYLAAADFRTEFLYSKKISPFLVGAGLNLSVGFPRKDYPASYKIHGQTVDAPKLLSATLYVPAGYSVCPWKNDIRIVTTVKAGAKMSSLAILTNVGSIIGDPVFSFFMSVGAGMQIKGLLLDFNCEYDTTGKVSPSVYLGYAFKLEKKNEK